MHQQLAAILTALIAAVAMIVTTSPAQAAPACTADPFESADASGGAPIAPGQSVQRVVCQDRATDVDREYWSFDAPGGKAYNVSLLPGASANLRDGLVIAGVLKQEADGSTGSIDSPNSIGFQGFTTPVLPAGRYTIVAANNNTITYPDFVAAAKPIQGSDGVFSIKLVESAPAPPLASLSVPATVKAREITRGSFTLSAPAPAGGLYLYFYHRGGNLSIPRTAVPAGATRGTFEMNFGPAAKGQKFTISAGTLVGDLVTVTTTIK